jgi:hypothetical protein
MMEKANVGHGKLKVGKTVRRRGVTLRSLFKVVV